MEEVLYTGELNHQIVIALLKAHNIHQVVASPGIANCFFIGSIQRDPFFRIISVIDERSAAYIACGIAFETGEPVVISCTGATASRDYMPGATEAFYSKLPILILTSSQSSSRVGHLCPQVTDRSAPPPDTTRLSVELPPIHSAEDEWACSIAVNKALLELRRHGGGPAHINLITAYGYNDRTALSHPSLPAVRKIERYVLGESWPEVSHERIGIFVGLHRPWSCKLTRCVERFCDRHNGVVLCDHTSNYEGKFKVLFPLAVNQAPANKNNLPVYHLDLLIHIGEISGEESAARMIHAKETWRVSPDGEIRDYFRNLTKVFECREDAFFEYYSNHGVNDTGGFLYKNCLEGYARLRATADTQMTILPFSNVWIARTLAPLIPSGSMVTLGILNTLRTWNYAEFNSGVRVFSPTGGFGIDGVPSLAIGSALSNPESLSFCIVGDLAFFYDLNSLGNRHITSNLRILLVNNGCGVEFMKTYSTAYRLLGKDVAPFVAAAGHYGNQSANLVKHFAEDLGFIYLSASSKSEFMTKLHAFVDAQDAPVILEVFVTADDEVSSLDIIHNRK